jgi:hypothetical protein
VIVLVTVLPERLPGFSATATPVWSGPDGAHGCGRVPLVIAIAGVAAVVVGVGLVLALLSTRGKSVGSTQVTAMWVGLYGVVAILVGVVIRFVEAQ